MAPKKQPQRLAPADDPWSITDEWGMYDPQKAGIPALFARLGRPVLTAAPATSKKERRRALRPERTAEGVGLAIAEAQQRAGLVAPDKLPPAGGNPARAMRLALKARESAQAATTGVAETVAAPPTPSAVTPPAARRRSTKATKSEAAPRAARKAAPATDAATPARRTARPRKSPVLRPQTAAAPATAPVPATAPAATAAAAPTTTPPPQPSPRRPRGPVPLAAWAHAVSDAPTRDTSAKDKRGFWRSVFRIPAEVALVEYAHGARIHRLLIESAPATPPEFI